MTEHKRLKAQRRTKRVKKTLNIIRNKGEKDEASVPVQETSEAKL